MNLKELIERRAGIVAQMDVFLKDMSVKGLTEARKGELEESWSRAEKEESELSSQIGRAKRMEEMHREEAERASVRTERTGGEAKDEKAEYRAAFERYFRYGAASLSPEQRAAIERRGTSTQIVGTAALGGHLAPEEFNPALVASMKSYSGIAQAATIITTSHGRELDWPTNDDTARKAVLTTEAAAIAVQNSTFGLKSLGAYKYTDHIKVSQELLNDSVLDIAAYCAAALGEGFGRAMNESCTIANGSSKPLGVVIAANTAGVTTASTTAITIEEILDLVHSIDPAYRNNAGGNVGFMFHDQTLKALKKLKDGENRPLWKPSVREGEPDTFDGYRYWLNQDMADTLAAAAKPILFGDFSKYYIRLVNAVEIRRADELFLANDLVGFFGFHRWDANLMDTAAIKHLAMAAS